MSSNLCAERDNSPARSFSEKRNQLVCLAESTGTMRIGE
jgi:hypothetical protein